ncbi:gamma-butyrobetaine dioxygenase-like isoform X1 [Macrobrachium nipponense]|uniref:gamma-butyrobetaine dioxygenase-like isoform X1 n=1 Tax=Macrobrachium nipponense TaxID=159736 RepID=UPI0030C8D444
MAYRPTTRVLLGGVAAFRNVATQQVRQICTKNCINCKTTRSLSLASNAWQQHQVKEKEAVEFPVPGVPISSTQVSKDSVTVKFGDGSESPMPYVWLRDNCRCPDCYSNEALGRKYLLTDLDVDVQALDIQSNDDVLNIKWSDGHVSEYPAEWLHARAFTPTARALRRRIYALPREPWGSNNKLREFDYEAMKRDDKVLLEWLLTMETQGSAMLKNVPDRDVAGPEMIEHIAFVKQSHYGPHSPVINRPNTNNVAFTNAKLGMHNDLPQYEQMPGIIFIHCLKQHVGTGGESVVADGLFGAELLRKEHPEAFQILTTTDSYFWDKGHANFSWEMDEFYKISKFPIITLNSSQEVTRIAVNNAIRDSYLDLPSNKVKKFYEAMKLFNDILYANSSTFKMDTGDLMTLDNVRCLHGREGYEAFSDRHIESSYLDWDEARCRRRRIQEKLGLLRTV